MPRYLRWIAAVTAGIVMQFAIQVLFLAIAVGGESDKEITLSGAEGALITFGAAILNVLTALGVNDWLSGKYPVERKGRAVEERTP
ncbi:MAG TPA: hypothetical protein VJ922_03100 [Actinomycetota bacterium]|nr:hypothetical protein [Actinomycetota bacterium]